MKVAGVESADNDPIKLDNIILELQKSSSICLVPRVLSGSRCRVTEA